MFSGRKPGKADPIKMPHRNESHPVPTGRDTWPQRQFSPTGSRSFPARSRAMQNRKSSLMHSSIPPMSRIRLHSAMCLSLVIQRINSLPLTSFREIVTRSPSFQHTSSGNPGESRTGQLREIFSDHRIWRYSSLTTYVLFSLGLDASRRSTGALNRTRRS